jgi:hypothetical protein
VPKPIRVVELVDRAKGLDRRNVPHSHRGYEDRPDDAPPCILCDQPLNQPSPFEIDKPFVVKDWYA